MRIITTSADNEVLIKKIPRMIGRRKSMSQVISFAANNVEQELQKDYTDKIKYFYFLTSCSSKTPIYIAGLISYCSVTYL